MNVTIKYDDQTVQNVAINRQAANAVKLEMKLSAWPEVDRLKAIAAAFISACDEVTPDENLSVASIQNRELAIAKTHMETAIMWAVKAAMENS